MNTYAITRAMIESAVAHGLKEIEEDPKRSARRLVDLGKQFSKNRFQDLIFSVMQELLDNENSAYYDMLANLLRNSDQDALKLFGVNMGYMGWSYGAGKIRKEQEELGVSLPWCILFRYAPGTPGGLKARQIISTVQQGQKLGIYVYFIRQSDAAQTPFEMLDLFAANKECAFIWVRESGRLTAAEIQLLGTCKNVVTVLPVNDPESLLTAELLREKKILFSLYTTYTDDTQFTDPNEMIFQNVLTAQSSLFFLIAGDNAKISYEKECYESRLKQEFPCLMLDYYGDARSLSRATLDHRHLLEIGADGAVIHPMEKAGTPFDFDAPLSETLRNIMPPRS